MIPEVQISRTAEYAARNLLREKGYEVVRVTEKHSQTPVLFHLIAWSAVMGVLFIRICPVRVRKTAASVHEEITELSYLVRTRGYPGEVQYWIRENTTWRWYRIYSGGAVQLSGVDHVW